MKKLCTNRIRELYVLIFTYKLTGSELAKHKNDKQHKNLLNKQIVIGIVVLLLVGIMPLQTFAEPKDDLPKVTILPDGTRIIEKGLHKAIAKPKYTTITDPTGFEATSAQYPTVAKLYLNNGPTYLCTGVLVDARWVLTAAHCVSNINTGKLTFKSGTAYFGSNSYSIASATVRPDWNGDYLYGNDIALLKLKSTVSGITPSTIDGSIDDLGKELNKAGYGRSGTGETGANTSAGTLHAGQNIYDSTHDQFWDRFNQGYLSDGVLMYDFDDGTPAHDAFFQHFGITNINSADYDDEVNSASGDSGGPTFDGTTVVGITSYGLTYSFDGITTDVDNSVNSSFGEYSGDTTVAKHKSWIDSVIGGGSDPGKPCNPKKPGCTP